ncbi:hypothetical protein BC831DRAFT_549993 [Entophlyctis helioformis]|nr:hypothetical protein BC831DRAFT_549993 [Entophlyctis helioformis]
MSEQPQQEVPATGTADGGRGRGRGRGDGAGAASRNQVRGPTSALSSFLRERGIRAPTGYHRRNPQQQQQQAEQADAPAAAPDGEAATADANEPSTVQVRVSTLADADAPAAVAGSSSSSSSATAATAVASAVQNVPAETDPLTVGTGSKRKTPARQAKGKGKANGNGKGKDEDDDDDDADFGGDNPYAPRSRHTKRSRRDAAAGPLNPAHPSALVQFCSRCQRRYVAASGGEGGGGGGRGAVSGLCGACVAIQQQPARAMSKIKRKKREMEVLAMSGELQGILLSLRDMCIKRVAELIDDVDQFGDIPYATKRQISKIISKSRHLNNRTVGLFLGADQDTVELFDCARIDEDGLGTIPLLCPNVRTLNLSLCGRITDSVLAEIGRSCSSLERLTLKGPFLPTNAGFSSLFRGVGEPLVEVVLENAAKLSTPAVQVLHDCCPNLAQLSLAACTRVDSDALAVVARMARLTRLSLAGIAKGVPVESLLALVDTVGPRLTALCLDGFELLDDTVVARISQVCRSLRPRTPAWSPLSLYRNVLLTNDVILCIVNLFGPSLEHLNLNGLDEITEPAMAALARGCPALVTLDVSWIRCLNDDILTQIMTTATHLTCIKVYGCHDLTPVTLNRVWRNTNDKIVQIQGNEFD